MKKLLLLTLQLFSLGLLAQAPQLINYQGIARNGAGEPLKNKTLGIRFELLQGAGASPTSVFTETQSIVTNSLGLFTTQIGKTNATALGAINFNLGELSLRTGIDTAGGSNFITVGVQKLVSVPFSMHAQSVPVTYTNNVLTIGKTSFTLDQMPLAMYTASTGISIISNSVVLNTLPDRTVNITPGNSNVSVTGTYPDFTVTSTPTLDLNANTLSISNGNSVIIQPPLTFTNNILTVGPVSNSISIPGGTVSILGTGAVAVTTLSPNSFSIHSPPTTLTQSNNIIVQGTFPNYTVSAISQSLTLLGANTLSITGGNTVAIAPSLTFTNNVLTVGPVSNTVSIPASTVNIVSSGAVTVTPLSANSFSIHAPLTSLTQSNNILIQGTYPNYTISALSPTLSLLGPNTLSISGGNTITIAPTLSLSGNILSVGPVTNTVSIPSGTFLATNISTTGVLTSTLVGNNYTLGVVPTNIAVTNSVGTATVSAIGTNSFNINIPPAVTQSLTLLTPTTLSITGANAVNLPTTSVSGTGAATVTGGPTNYNVNVPPTNVAVTNSVGAATVSSIGTNSFNINIPPTSSQSLTLLSPNSLSITGSNSVVIAPTLSLTGNVLSVGVPSNAVTIPTTNVTGTGAATVTGGPTNYNVNVPPTNVAVTNSVGAATVSSIGTNSFNINIPPTSSQSLTLLSPNSLSITGSNSVVIAPTLSLTGNVLSVGVPSNAVTIPTTNVTGTGAATVTGGPTNYNVNVPPTNVALTNSVGTATVTSIGTNSFNINIPPSSSQSLTLLSPNSLSITGSNSVVIAPTLSLTGNVLSVGVSTNAVTIPTTNVTGTGAATVTGGPTNYNVNVPPTNVAVTNSVGTATVTSIGTNSFNINIPPAITQSLSLLSPNTISITGGNSLTLAPTTFSNGGGMTIQGSHPNYTLAATQTLSLVGNNLTISNGNTIPLPSNTIVAATTTLTGTGAADVTTVTANYFIVDVTPTLSFNNNTLGISDGNSVTIVPTLSVVSGNVLQVGPSSNTITLPGQSSQSLTLLSPNSLSITGSNSVVIAPTLSLTGNVLSVGVSTNAVTIPTTNVTGTGAATVTGGPTNYNVNVPPTNVAVTNSVGAASVSSIGTNSFNINIPPSSSQSLTLLSPNSLSITGSNSVVIAPTLSLTGSVLSVGVSTNAVTIPTTNVTGTGAATVTGGPTNYNVNVPPTNVAVTNSVGAASVSSIGTNSFNINIPPSSSQSLTLLSPNSLSITGSNSVVIAPTLSLTGNVLSVGVSTNAVTIPTTNVTGTGAATVTGGPANYNVNVPPTNVAVTNSVGAATVSSIGTNSFNINIPPASSQSLTLLSPNSLSITGSNSVVIAPTLSLTGNVLSVGVSTNAVTIPTTNVTGTGAATVTGGPTNYNVNVPPTNVAVTNSVGAASVSSIGTNSFNINIPPASSQSLTLLSPNSLSITGSNSVVIAPTLSLTGNVLSVGVSTNAVTIPTTNVTGTGAATVTGGPTNYNVNVPPTNVAVTNSVGAASVSSIGTNSFNINIPPASSQSLTLLSPNSLSITGSNSVVIAPTLGLVGNVLSVGVPSNAVTIPTTNVTGTGAATVTGGPTNYNVNVPPTNVAVTNSVGAATVSLIGTNSFNINIPPTTTQSLTLLSPNSLSITGSNSVLIAPTLGLVGNVLSVGVPSNAVTIPTTNVTGSGAAAVTGGPTNYNVNVPLTNVAVTNSVGTATVSAIGTNSFNINIPPATTQSLTLLSPNSLSITGSNSVLIAPTLGLVGNVLSVGVPSNAVTIPTTNVTGTGAAAVTGGPTNYNVNVPLTNVAVTNSVGTATVSAIGTNSFNINIPPATTQSLTLLSPNSLSITGSNSVLIAPTLGLVGNVLSVGIATNAVTIPTTGIVNQGVLSQTVSGSNYTLNVPAPTYSSGALTTGTSVINITPTLAMSGTTLSVGNASNTINLTAISPWRQATSAVTLATGSDNVGIGVSAPIAKLEVISSGSVHSLAVLNSNSSLNTFAGFFDGGLFARGKNNTGSGYAFRSQNANGDNLLTVTNNGKVGIGTFTPTQEFEIETNANTAMSIVSGTVDNSSLYFGDANNHFMGSIRYNNSDESMNFWTNNTNNRLKIDGSGFVGINEVTPLERLHVTGNVRFSGALMPAGSAGVAGQYLVSQGGGAAPTWNTITGLLSGGTINYLPKWNSATGLSSISQVFDNGTNVGIGTNNPDAKLNIEGTVDFGTGNSVTGIMAGAIGSNHTVSGNRAWSFGNWTQATNLGSMLLGDWGGGNPSPLTTSADDQFAARFDGGYKFYTDGTLSNAGGIFFSPTGKVGIGVASPTAALAVGNGTVEKIQISGIDGDINILDEQATITFPAVTSTLVPMINMFSSGTTNAKRMVLQHSPPFPTWGLQYDDGLDEFTFLGGGTPVLHVELGGTHVGIGTYATNLNSTSGRVLTISSNSTYVNSTAALELQGASTSTTSAFGKIDFNNLVTTGASTNTARIAAHRGVNGNEGELAFSTHNGTSLAEKLRIDKDGHVGIGTDAPPYKLSVVGPTGSGTDGPNQSFGFIGDQYPSMEIFNWAHSEQHIFFNAYYEPFAFKSSDPGANFSITNFNNVLRLEYDAGVPVGGSIGFTSGLAMTNIGRVGINTASPTATLHVAGTTRLVDGTQGVDKVLTSDASGNATWQNSSRNTGFSAYGIVSQSIPTNWTQLTLGGEDFDDGSDFASSAYTAPTAGVYQFNATVSWASTMLGTSYSFIAIYKNGVPFKYRMEATNSNNFSNDISVTMKLNASDVITVWVVQFETASTHNTVAGSQFTHFSGFRLY